MAGLRWFLSVLVILSNLIACSSDDGGDNSSGPSQSSSFSYPANIVIEVSDQTVNLSWETIAGAEHYELLIDSQVDLTNETARSANFQQFLNITATNIAVSGLINDTVYYFRVRSIASNGAASDYSPVNTAIPKRALPAAALDLAAAQVGPTSVTLTWTPVVGASFYKLYRATSQNASIFTALNENLTPDTFSFTDNSVLASTIYVYRLIVSNESGDSPATDITYVPVPETPTNFNAAAVSDKVVNLSWTAGDSITEHFELSRSQDNGVNFTDVALNITVTNYQDNGLVGGTGYVYRVIAVNAGGKSQALSANYTAPQVPSMPSGFSASFVSGTSVNLSWVVDATATNGYKLYRAAAGSPNFTALDEAIAANASSYTDATVLPNTIYDYQLIASNLAGNSIAAVVRYVPPAATPTNFTAVAVSEQVVNLSWVAGDAITDHYELSRSEDGGVNFVDLSLNVNVSNYQDIGLVGGGSYVYKIVAVNTGGKSQALTGNYTAPLLPATPSGFTAAYVSGTSVSLSWIVDAAATNGYKLYRAPTGSGGFTPVNESIPSGVASYTDATIAESTVYDYQLIASSAVGDSTAATLTYMPPPKPPINVSASQIDNTSIRITWTKGDALTAGYVLLRQDDPLSAFVLLNNNIAADALSFDDTNLLDNHLYAYELYAFNTNGDASLSIIYNFTTLVKPVAPSLMAVVANGPVVNLSWGVADSATQQLILSRSVAGAASYTILNSTTVPTLATGYSDSTVTSGNVYDYQLQAFNGVMSSDPILASNIAVPGIPVAPSVLSVGDVTATSASFTWVDNSSDEDNFVLERAQQTSPTTWGAFVAVKSTSANATSIVDDTASYSPGAHYKYRVLAQNAVGAAPSNEVTTIAPPVDNDVFLAFSNRTAPRFNETDITAKAYYAAIDPQNLKTNVTAWKQQNGFGSGGPEDTPAVYVNDADLGFARRMYVNPAAPGSKAGVSKIASYVENYATLDAAKSGDPTQLIATVAMEYTEGANPGTDPVVLMESPQFDQIQHFVKLVNLEPGSYVFGVIPEYYLGTSTPTFSFKVIDTVSATNLLDIASDTWPLNRFRFKNSLNRYSFFSDQSGKRYTADITAPITVQIELDTTVHASIFIARQYKIVAQATAATPGGSISLPAQNLSAGRYRVIYGSKDLYSQYTAASLVNINVNIPAIGDTTFTNYLVNVGSNSDPANPYNYDLSFDVDPSYVDPTSLTTPVKIDLTMADPTSPITPVIFLADPHITAADTTITVLEGLYSNIPDYLDRTSFDIALPDGPYSAVVTTRKFDNSFGLQFFDNLTQTDFLCDGGAPTAVTLSAGTNPFLPGNPRCNFSFSSGIGNNPLSIVARNTDLNAFGRPAGTGIPILKLLGIADEFRHLIAYTHTGNSEPNPHVILRKNLPAGNYTVIPVATEVGYTLTYQLTVTNVGSGASLLNATGGWSPSPGFLLDSPLNSSYTFSVPNGGADIEIYLDMPLSNGGNWFLSTGLYLKDATGAVIDQSDNERYNNGLFEADLLAGDYQISLASDSGNDLDYRSAATVMLYIDNVLTNTFSGVVSEYDQENPYSPRAPRFGFSTTKPSHVRVEVDSDYFVYAALLGKGDRKFVTFYTFIGQKGWDGLTNNGTQTPPAPFYPPDLKVGDRVLAANLDGRGDKYQPGVCNVCHGGEPKSLVAGVYPDQGDTNAGFLAWDMDLFIYDTLPGSPYERTTLEPTIREFNRAVLSVQREPIRNTYHLSARTEMIYGWYGGPGLPNAFSGSYVPSRWGFAPDLYLQVVKPTCRLCHVQRDGLTSQLITGGGLSIAFNSYDDFVGYKDDIEKLVYDEGSMPAAKRTFDHFWSKGQADLLAQYLNSPTNPFNRYDAQGQVLLPGRPIAAMPYRADLPQTLVANADLKRYMPTNGSLTLDGSNSLFAANYAWTVTPQVAGAGFSLTGQNTANPVFTPLVDGDYTVQLIVYDAANNASSPATMVINASQTYTPVSFSQSLSPIYNKASKVYDYPDYPARTHPFRECLSCHSRKETDFNYDGPGDLNHGVEKNIGSNVWSLSGTSQQAYDAILDRVNLKDPLESQILQVGDRFHHPATNPYGWGWDDFNNNWEHYNLLLRWINEGANNN